MSEEKTLRVKFATWKRLMELSLSLGDSQRLSIDTVIGRLLRLWDGAQEEPCDCSMDRCEIMEKDSGGITTRTPV